MATPGTHFSNLTGDYHKTSVDPTGPISGDEFFDPARNFLCRYSGNNWLCIQASTTSTSTSSSTSTSTSTSTTSTSTSTSTTTSTSTSTTTTG